ncbi:MAG TPA: methylmalonyl-CoA decarboxylase [Pirellulales bacterium]|jgi:methylmalonyl-CoA decarboxylase|nr:methylmalonyl-CoA decarboxylase [Pirellulales bacterium]
MSTATLPARKPSADAGAQATVPAALVLTEIADSVGTITLNQPAKRNALSAAMVEEMLAALAVFRKASVRCVILRAAHDVKVFSAGHDIGELPAGQDPLPYGDPLERLLRGIKTFPAPVMAMVHGSVWGGATDLVLSCDMIVGDETSAFAITPANLGLAYNTVGLLQCLRRLPLNLVKEMFFTAASIKAEDAAKWGILNHLVPVGQLEQFTYALARRITEKAPLAVAAIKEQLRVLVDATPVTPEVLERIEQLRHDVYRSADYAEGIAAFHEKRKPVFTGK